MPYCRGMQFGNVVRRALRANLLHILVIAVSAFTLAAVVVSAVGTPASRPAGPQGIRGPVELLPVIITPPALIAPMPCPPAAGQPSRSALRCGRASLPGSSPSR